jgi:hypothetical protein
LNSVGVVFSSRSLICSGASARYRKTLSFGYLVSISVISWGLAMASEVSGVGSAAKIEVCTGRELLRSGWSSTAFKLWPVYGPRLEERPGNAIRAHF